MNHSTAMFNDANSPSSDSSPRVAIVGGGISGLAAALRTRELLPQASVQLFESSPHLGGVLQTERRNGYVLEQSADNFITDSPWAIDFCRRVGLADELIPTNPGNRRAGVVSRGNIAKLPDGFALLVPGKWSSLWWSPLLSLPGKLRLACEYFIPRRREEGDESFASFARRRLGREAYERIAQPLVSGIYTADPERLSMQAALARFVEMERSDGSLIRATRRMRSRKENPIGSGTGGDTEVESAGQEAGPRYGLFVAPREGISQLVDAAARSLPSDCVSLGAAVQRLSPSVADPARTGWVLEVAGGEPPQHPTFFDAVILAVPSGSAARLVHAFDAALGDELAAIEYAGCVVALVGCRQEQITRPFEGFGFVVPQVEKRKILACSCSSAKFPGRAPPGRVLLRVFVGGATQPDMNQWPVEALRREIIGELAELIGFVGEPELFETVRWTNAMPQYHVGHVDRVAAIERHLEKFPTLALAGNAFRGVGIPHCIQSGEQAAERIAESLRRRTAGTS